MNLKVACEFEVATVVGYHRFFNASNCLLLQVKRSVVQRAVILWIWPFPFWPAWCMTDMGSLFEHRSPWPWWPMIIIQDHYCHILRHMFMASAVNMLLTCFFITVCALHLPVYAHIYQQLHGRTFLYSLDYGSPHIDICWNVKKWDYWTNFISQKE